MGKGKWVMVIIIKYEKSVLVAVSTERWYTLKEDACLGPEVVMLGDPQLRT